MLSSIFSTKTCCYLCLVVTTEKRQAPRTGSMHGKPVGRTHRLRVSNGKRYEFRRFDDRGTSGDTDLGRHRRLDGRHHHPDELDLSLSGLASRPLQRRSREDRGSSVRSLGGNRRNSAHRRTISIFGSDRQTSGFPATPKRNELRDRVRMGFDSEQSGSGNIGSIGNHVARRADHAARGSHCPAT